MESKFLDQDVDVVSLANKGIVIGCFVGRNYNKILMETRKLTDNIRVTKNGLGSGVDRIVFSFFFFIILFLSHYLRSAVSLPFFIGSFSYLAT